MKARLAFLLAPLDPGGAGYMLNRVASEMRCAPVELGHWLINMREAQRSLDMILCRQEAETFVPSTKMGLQENGRPSLIGTTLWLGRCSTNR
jgi:hypothetical protein